MSPELLSRFEPVAREQIKQVVTNRVSQFFTVDSYRVEGDWVVVVEPLNLELLNRSDGKLNGLNGAQRLNSLNVLNNIQCWRTETERKPYQYRVILRYVERTQQNPYDLVVSSVEQTEIPAASFPNSQSKN